MTSTVKTTRLSHSSFEPAGFPETKFAIGAPLIVQKYLHEFDMNMGELIQSDGIIPSADRDRYLIDSLMEEAIAQSAGGSRHMKKGGKRHA